MRSVHLSLLCRGLSVAGLRCVAQAHRAAAKCGETALTLTSAVRYRTVLGRRHPRAKGQQQWAPEGGGPLPGSLSFLFPEFSAAGELAWQNLVINPLWQITQRQDTN